MFFNRSSGKKDKKNRGPQPQPAARSTNEPTPALPPQHPTQDVDISLEQSQSARPSATSLDISPDDAPRVAEPSSFEDENPFLKGHKGIRVEGGARADADPSAGAVGLPIDTYATTHRMTEAEVWGRLRRGELVARNRQGRLLVFENGATGDNAPSAPASASTDNGSATTNTRDRTNSWQVTSTKDVDGTISVDETASSSAIPKNAGPAIQSSDASQETTPSQNQRIAGATGKAASDLPPLPPLNDDQDQEKSVADLNEIFSKGSLVEKPSGTTDLGAYLTSSDRPGNQEIALLLDHLSLAKEENLQILKMTQDSIKKVTELSDNIVEMKDAVIDAKSTQIQALKEQLIAADRQNARLKQENEDLQMLTRTLSEQTHNDHQK